MFHKWRLSEEFQVLDHWKLLIIIIIHKITASVTEGRLFLNSHKLLAGFQTSSHTDRKELSTWGSCGGTALQNTFTQLQTDLQLAHGSGEALDKLQNRITLRPIQGLLASSNLIKQSIIISNSEDIHFYWLCHSLWRMSFQTAWWNLISAYCKPSWTCSEYSKCFFFLY